MKEKYPNLMTLNEIMALAENGQYAVGAFNARYTSMIGTILKTAEKNQSPVIVQISSKEFERFNTKPADYGKEFYHQLDALEITVPVCLHLDHSWDFEIIKAAIKAGFTSVMIDASEHPYEKNIELTKEVVAYAHEHGVSVEAELGKIGTTDFLETDIDEELYTDPVEAKEFVERTNVDALAVSVGTAHGVYDVREPKVDFQRLQEIRKQTDVHLVLHGASGVPKEMVQGACKIEGGGVSKVNIATDLELAFLHAVDRQERFPSNEAANQLPEAQLGAALLAVENKVSEKMNDFLLSSHRV